MQFLENVKTALSLLPELIKTVQAVEDLIPASGSGKQKLELVRNTLQAVYTVGGASIEQFQAFWPVLESMISVFVKFANDTGLFKKKTV